MTATFFGTMTGLGRQSTKALASESIGSSARGQEFGRIVDILKSPDAMTSSGGELEETKGDLLQIPHSSEARFLKSVRVSVPDDDHFDTDSGGRPGGGDTSAIPIDDESLKRSQQSLFIHFIPQDCPFVHSQSAVTGAQGETHSCGMNGDASAGVLIEDRRRESLVARADTSKLTFLRQESLASDSSDKIDKRVLDSRASVGTISTDNRCVSDSPAGSNVIALTRNTGSGSVENSDIALNSGRINALNSTSKGEILIGAYSKERRVEEYLAEGEFTGKTTRPGDMSSRFGEATQKMNRDEQLLIDAVEGREFKTVAAVVNAVSHAQSAVGISDTASLDKEIAVTPIHITEMTTHFPIVIIDELSGAENGASGVERDIAAEVSFGLPFQSTISSRVVDRVRILRFKLEPAELGEVLVKMRVRDSRIEIEIEAQSVVTTEAISRARDALSVAIEHRGTALDAFDINTRGNSNASPSGESDGSYEGRNHAQSSDQGGFFNGERSQKEQKDPADFKIAIRQRDDVSHLHDSISTILL